jgi:hypothetical protein
MQTLVYLVVHKAPTRWTMPIRRWREALNHFAIILDRRHPLRSGPELPQPHSQTRRHKSKHAGRILG